MLRENKAVAVAGRSDSMAYLSRDLNRVQKSKWSKQYEHAHHLKTFKWLDTNKVTAE